MAVLVREMELHCREKAMGDDLRLVRSQIDRCKEILSKMSSDAGQLQAVAGHALGIDDYLQEITNEWHQLRADIRFNVNWHGVNPVPTIIADHTLTHAIINVLNNAADASSRSVEIDDHWTENSLTDQSVSGLGFPEKSTFSTGSPGSPGLTCINGCALDSRAALAIIQGFSVALTGPRVCSLFMRCRLVREFSSAAR